MHSQPEMKDTSEPAANPSKRPWVSKKALAEHCNVTVGCIDKWMKQRRIPYLKLSNRLVRFNLEDCDAALRKYEVRPRG